MRIEALSLEARVLYTAFCVFLLIGYVSSALLARDIGASREAVGSYYLGAALPAKTAPGGGPAIELEPESAPMVELRAAKSDRQMLETFHFHLFTVPVLLLILGHLFMLTGLSLRAKIAWILGASVSTLAHVFAPIAVRYGGAAFAPLMPLSGALSGVTWTVLTAWPVVEMWRPRAASQVEAPKAA